MPILASSMYVNAYGKSAGVVTVTAPPPLPLESMDMSIDAYIVKYNTSGKAMWTARIASIVGDLTYAIATDTLGNVYIGGLGGLTGSSNAMTFYNFDGSVFQPKLANTGGDGFIVKYNTNGVVQWTARIASAGSNRVTGLAIDPSGNVYVTGTGASGVARTAFSSNGVAFGTVIPSAGSFDVFIVKYNTNGIVQWVARVASPGGDTGFGVATDSGGNVYLTGQGPTSGAMTAFSSDGVGFGTTIPTAGNTDVFVVKYNTNGIVQWVARIGSTGLDIGVSIATDSIGSVYVTGQGGSAIVSAFSANGTAFGTTLPNAGGGDAFVVKYDTNGTVQWVARVASSGTDSGWAIATSSGGDVYVAGQGITGTITAFSSNGAGFGTTLPNGGGGDAFLIKYDTNGTVQWVARVASSGSDSGFGVTVDSGGNIYMAGTTGTGVPTSAFNANGTAFANSIASGGGIDSFIVKYNSSGVVQWLARIAGSSDDDARGIAVDSNGNAYTTGSFTGNRLSIFGQSTSLFSSIPNLGGIDGFIVKYNPNGAPQWAARFGSSFGNDFGYAVASDSAGNVYVTGIGGSGADITAFSSNGAQFATILPNSGGTDVFIIKYNPSGIVQWLARVASAAADIGFEVAIDSVGSVYVTGQGGNSALVTAFSANGVAFPTTVQNSANGSDIFVVKYNTDGAVQWLTRIASNGIDIGYGIAADSVGDVYVTGQGGIGVVTAFSSNGVAFGSTIAHAGQGDTFVVKYNTNGIVQWVTRIASTAADIGYAVTTDGSGNLYVAGQGGADVVLTIFSSNGVAFATTLASSGGTDVFLVKYNSSGIVQWVTRLGSAGIDIGFRLAADLTGNIYVSGASGDTTMRAFNSDGTSYPVLVGFPGFLVKYNTNGFVQWTVETPSSNLAVATDSLGNVYTSGQYGGVTVNSLFRSSSGEVFANVFGSASLIKYDTNGNGQWVQIVRGTGLTAAVATTRGICVDPFGNCVITGGNASGQGLRLYNLDNTPYLFLSSGGGADAFVVKYSSLAIPQWVARVSTTGADFAFGIATDSSGDIYFTGRGEFGATIQAFNADGSVFATTLPNSGNTDTFLVKYSTAGVVRWIARVASSAADTGFAVATDSSGSVYTVGQAQGATLFNADGTVFATIGTSGSGDAVVVKYNTNGVVQWGARIGSSVTDIAYAVATDPGGDVYVTGQAGVFSVFNADGSLFGSRTNQGGTDVFIVKYNTNGVAQWVARIQSITNDIGFAIAANATGVYVTGQGGAGTRILDANGAPFRSFTSLGGTSDVFVASYDLTGNVLWVARIGSTGTDIGNAIAVDPSGSVYVVGGGAIAVVTAFNSDETAFATTLPNSGSTDTFVVKYNATGFVQWIARIFGTTGFAVRSDSAGDVYVSGNVASGTAVISYNSDGSFFGSSANDSTFAAAYIVKYNSAGFVQWMSKMAGSRDSFARGIALDSSNNIYQVGNMVGSQLIAYDA